MELFVLWQLKFITSNKYMVTQISLLNFSFDYHSIFWQLMALENHSACRHSTYRRSNHNDRISPWLYTLFVLIQTDLISFEGLLPVNISLLMLYCSDVRWKMILYKRNNDKSTFSGLIWSSWLLYNKIRWIAFWKLWNADTF